MRQPSGVCYAKSMLNVLAHLASACLWISGLISLPIEIISRNLILKSQVYANLYYVGCYIEALLLADRRWQFYDSQTDINTSKFNFSFTIRRKKNHAFVIDNKFTDNIFALKQLTSWCRISIAIIYFFQNWWAIGSFVELYGNDM